MKIKVGQLRKLITEIAASGDIPSSGDIFIYPSEPEYGGEEIGEEHIDDAGDLSTAKDEDFYDTGGGPKPGEQGIWIWCHDMAWTFNPGELVSVPKHDSGTARAWAKKKNVQKLGELLQSRYGSPLDSSILKILGSVTTYGIPSLNAVKAFSIRPRKDSIYFHYSEFGGIEGAINQADINKLKMTIPELAEWMFAHGARKIKPQKRTRSTSYYD